LLTRVGAKSSFTFWAPMPRAKDRKNTEELIAALKPDTTGLC
jgi:hypothetical protein